VTEIDDHSHSDDEDHEYSEVSVKIMLILIDEYGENIFRQDIRCGYYPHRTPVPKLTAKLRRIAKKTVSKEYSTKKKSNSHPTLTKEIEFKSLAMKGGQK